MNQWLPFANCSPSPPEPEHKWQVYFSISCSCSKEEKFNSLLPGLKLEWHVFTTALPIPGHKRVKYWNYALGQIQSPWSTQSSKLSIHNDTCLALSYAEWAFTVVYSWFTQCPQTLWRRVHVWYHGYWRSKMSLTNNIPSFCFWQWYQDFCLDFQKLTYDH